MKEPYISAKDVAKHFDCDVSHVYRMARAGKIRSIRFSGVKFLLSELLEDARGGPEKPSEPTEPAKPETQQKRRRKLQGEPDYFTFVRAR